MQYICGYQIESRTTDYLIAEPIRTISQEAETVFPQAPIILKELSDKKFFLKHAIQVSIDTEIDGYILSNDILNVHVFGKTIDSARLEWETVLVDLYLSYRDTPDDQLAVSAKALKDQLQGAIGESNAD